MLNSKNPYYIESTYMTTQQQFYMKENNVYLLNILTNLMKYGGNTATLNPNYKKRILSGQLYHSDKKTGIDTHDLGEKLKALYIALDKPENREKFFNSFFYTAMSRISTGNTNLDNTDEEWLNYTKTPNCDDDLKLKTPLAAAIECYRLDNTVPIGLNMSKFFDNIIQKKADGKYEIIETTAEQGDLMYQATCEQVRALKRIPKFQRSFTNEKLKKEYDDSENDV